MNSLFLNLLARHWSTSGQCDGNDAMTPEIDIAASFPADYAAARERFTARCEALGGTMQAFVNPSRGPAGETLRQPVEQSIFERVVIEHGGIDEARDCRAFLARGRTRV